MQGTSNFLTFEYCQFGFHIILFLLAVFALFLENQVQAPIILRFFVPILKRMILDNEIEEICCLSLHNRIQILTTEYLLHRLSEKPGLDTNQSINYPL